MKCFITIQEQRNIERLAKDNVLAMLVYRLILEEADHCDSIDISERDIIYLLKSKENIRVNRFDVRNTLLYLIKKRVIKAMHCNRKVVFVLNFEDVESEEMITNPEKKVTLTLKRVSYLKEVDLSLN